MMWILYSLLVTVLSPAALVLYAIKHGWRRATMGLRERLGIDGVSAAPRRSSHQPRLWFHAASIGELEAVRDVLSFLRSRYPQGFFSLTTLTPEAKALALQERIADEVRLAPLDLPCIIRRFLNAIDPQVLVLVETELWPGLIRETNRSGRKVVLINGRLSTSSARRWALLGPWIKELLRSLQMILVRSELDRRRFVSLGAFPETTLATGNLKLVRAARRTLPNRDELWKRLSLDPEQKPVVIAGSTWPEEEEIIVRALLPLKRRWPRLLLVLAPRRLSRTSEVERILRTAGLSYVLRSHRSFQSTSQPFDCLLIDTLGELAELYGLADVAIIGGSLVAQGGQNPIEPAAWGIPVLFGPSMDNFQEVAEDMLRTGAARHVIPETLTSELEQTLTNEAARRASGEAARRTVDSQTQILEKTIHAIESALNA